MFESKVYAIILILHKSLPEILVTCFESIRLCSLFNDFYYTYKTFAHFIWALLHYYRN